MLTTLISGDLIAHGVDEWLAWHTSTPQQYYYSVVLNSNDTVAVSAALCGQQYLALKNAEANIGWCRT